MFNLLIINLILLFVYVRTLTPVQEIKTEVKRKRVK